MKSLFKTMRRTFEGKINKHFASNLPKGVKLHKLARLEKQAQRFQYELPLHTTPGTLLSIGREYSVDLFERMRDDPTISLLPYPNQVLQIDFPTGMECDLSTNLGKLEDSTHGILKNGVSYYIMMAEGTESRGEHRGYLFMEFLLVSHHHTSNVTVPLTSVTINKSNGSFGYEMNPMFPKDLSEMESKLIYSQALELAMFVFAMMEAERILVSKNDLMHPRTKKSHSRSDKQLPINEYKILQVGLPQHIRENEESKGGTSSEQRMHWRRGHWRHYSTPTRAGKTRVRVPAYCAGNPALGIIHKKYEVI